MKIVENQTTGDKSLLYAGDRYSSVQMSAIMMVGIFAMVVAGIQPVVLGALQSAGRINLSQMGIAATVELLALGLMSAVAEVIFSVRYLRIIGVGTGVVLVALNLLSTLVSAWGLITMRALAGIAGGILVWITAGLITRSRAPERFSAIFLTTQTMAQFGVATFLPLIGLHNNADLGLWVLAGIATLATFSSLLVPRAYVPLPKAAESGGAGAMNGATFVNLLLVVAQLAFAVGLWIYMEPLAQRSGLSHHITSIAIAVGLGAQILGGIAVMIAPTRLSPMCVFTVAGVVNLLALAVFASHPSAPLFLVSVFVFGFLLLFVMPFQTLAVVRADPSKRAAMLVPFAQLLGASLGPFAASMVVSETDITGVLVLGAGWIALWFAGLAWLGATQSRKKRLAAA
jgi:MFS transporter, DHA1 family, inner membrane transport protein